MYQALPYKTWHPAAATTTASIPVPLPPPFNRDSSSTGSSGDGNLISRREDVKGIVTENAVVVTGRRGCCMSHVVKRLLLGLGVNPAVYEVDEDDEKDVLNELKMITAATGEEKGREVQLPAVFIGGKLFGGLDRIMATHITGELTPILREAGALWL
ncbi:Glutaredoxin-C9 [Dionaea muscipula]